MVALIVTSSSDGNNLFVTVCSCFSPLSLFLFFFFCCSQTWQETDREFLKKVGKMAFKLLEKGRPLFHEEDMKDYSLTVEEVAVYSGIVTELPVESKKRRTFSFIHYTFQVAPPL